MGVLTPSFHTRATRQTSLTVLEKSYVLAALPRGTTIVSAEYFDNYDLPCPVKVAIRLHGEIDYVVLRKARHGSVYTEATLLEVLTELKLPVPRVLAEPEINETGEAMCLLSLLPGRNLQKLSMISPAHRQTAKGLLIRAVDMLTAITPSLDDGLQGLIPRFILATHVKKLVECGSPWLSDSLCQEALIRVRAAVETIDTPLVFTNGDYQPGNYLTEKGQITGFLDFEDASFQDPLLGWVKYPTDDLHPLNKAGVVRQFLKQNGFRNEDFAVRLALGTLTKLCSLPIEVSPEDKPYELHLVRILREFCNGSIDLFDT